MHTEWSHLGNRIFVSGWWKTLMSHQLHCKPSFRQSLNILITKIHLQGVVSSTQAHTRNLFSKSLLSHHWSSSVILQHIFSLQRKSCQRCCRRLLICWRQSSLEWVALKEDLSTLELQRKSRELLLMSALFLIRLMWNCCLKSRRLSYSLQARLYSLPHRLLYQYPRTYLWSMGP